MGEGSFIRQAVLRLPMGDFFSTTFAFRIQPEKEKIPPKKGGGNWLKNKNILPRNGKNFTRKGSRESA
jgi:hypothetical protein